VTEGKKQKRAGAHFFGFRRPKSFVGSLPALHARRVPFIPRLGIRQTSCNAVRITS
jgi:hypothetical protein